MTYHDVPVICNIAVPDGYRVREDVDEHGPVAFGMYGQECIYTFHGPLCQIECLRAILNHQNSVIIEYIGDLDTLLGDWPHDDEGIECLLPGPLQGPRWT